MLASASTNTQGARRMSEVAQETPSFRAIVAGSILAIVLCAMNSYLTLSFGVIEEGPTIAALFFFALFLLAKRKVTTHEMVIVATMGSAGGSLGFITNFFAAKAMTGPAYSFTQMVSFCVATSLVGLVMVMPLRQLLILREDLPWPGSRAVETVIRALVQHGDPRQARLLLIGTLSMMAIVICNTDMGFGWIPAETALFGLAAIAWSPFAIGGSYLMGMRTCVGFLLGAVMLMILAHSFPAQYAATPERFFWPGLGFLVAAGLVNLAMNYKAFAGAFASILALGEKTDDDDPIMSSKLFAVCAAVSFVAAFAVMVWVFGVPALIVAVLIAIGGFVQNIIATRAAAITTFNPARVMGILLQGVTSAMGGRTIAINLTGAGFVAGSGAQAGVLTADMAYGRALKVPSRHQFWTQTLTVLPCSFVSAVVFQQINATEPMTFDSRIAAPIAKMWAASALIFDGTSPLPDGAVRWLILGAIVGALYTLAERVEKIGKWMPESTGVGLGLVLSVSIGITFFLGGFLMWVVLGRWLKWSETTLTTVAVASIVAEGLGGVAKPLLTLAAVLVR